ncbi:peptide deformylase [Sansalvadorimonas verongulae]|uniref:peptide deformylase n=1 Tax=Sansalvadorimonas verongulae TaxID=2172824 RepID=UPI0012BD50C2|nr:peptide deformylase [Sansalvadorimonas verongulae]MTI14187.1 peptide deformylase [Sansalvadorimonas verongulae]
MAKLDILEFPDPRLRKPGEKVESVTDETRQLIDDMYETMYDADGCGLAATQVNVQKRLFIMDFSEDKSEPWTFINPEITPLTDEIADLAEGCLSVPGFFEKLDRPNRVKVKALDRDGKEFEQEFEGIQSICVQHELDHLDGVLFVDALTKLKRDRIRKKLEKAQRLAAK